jgi:hypothetical protein
VVGIFPIRFTAWSSAIPSATLHRRFPRFHQNNVVTVSWNRGLYVFYRITWSHRVLPRWYIAPPLPPMKFCKRGKVPFSQHVDLPPPLLYPHELRWANSGAVSGVVCVFIPQYYSALSKITVTVLTLLMAHFPTVPLLWDADYFLRNLAQLAYLKEFLTPGRPGDKFCTLAPKSFGCLRILTLWRRNFLLNNSTPCI